MIPHELADQGDLALAEPRQPGVEHEVARVLVVVVVVDRDADVVQQAGGAEQLARARVAVVQARRREVVEQAQRQRSDVARVSGRGVVLRGEVQHAGAAHVAEQRPFAARQRALEEHALAKPCLSRLDRLEVTGLEHRLDHDRAGQHDVTARGLDPRHAAALGGRHRGETVDQIIERRTLDHEALDAEGGHRQLTLDRRGEVAHRPADADDPPPAAREPVGALQLARDVLAQPVELFRAGRFVAGQEALRHAHRAEPPGIQALRVAPRDLDKLHRSAAEIQHRAVAQVGRVDRGEVPGAPLLLTREDAHFQAGRARALQDLRGVGRLADRARRHHVDFARLQAGGFAEVGENLDRSDAARDALLAERATAVDARADPHRLVDLVGALPPAGKSPLLLRMDAEDDEPERVRAEVDDCEARVLLRAEAVSRHVRSARCDTRPGHAQNRSASRLR